MFQRHFVFVFERIDSIDRWNPDCNSKPVARKCAWKISNLVLFEPSSPNGWSQDLVENSRRNFLKRKSNIQKNKINLTNIMRKKLSDNINYV